MKTFLLPLLRIIQGHKLNHETVIVILAVYFGLVLNFPFNQRIIALSDGGQLLFSLTPALVLTACFTIIFSLFPSKYIFKPIMVLLLCTSAAAMYATLKYNIMFDYSMVENILETNSGEAESYLNAQSNPDKPHLETLPLPSKSECVRPIEASRSGTRSGRATPPSRTR